VQADPADPWRIAGRGQTYRALGRTDEALADLDAALALDPELDWAAAERADILRDTGGAATPAG